MRTTSGILCALALAFSLAMLACQPVEKTARDTAAALSGSIVAAQTRYQGQCQQTPTRDVCQLINRAVASQNALVSAVETYCGWQVSLAPPDPNAKCRPVKSAQAALETAITNAATITQQIKGAIQ